MSRGVIDIDRVDRSASRMAGGIIGECRAEYAERQSRGHVDGGEMGRRISRLVRIRMRHIVIKRAEVVTVRRLDGDRYLTIKDKVTGLKAADRDIECQVIAGINMDCVGTAYRDKRPNVRKRVDSRHSPQVDSIALAIAEIGYCIIIAGWRITVGHIVIINK